MAQLGKSSFEVKNNDAGTGAFKTGQTRGIGSDDMRTFTEDLADSVPFTTDDSFTWPFPQVTASGTDTYTATLSPAITAYVAGQKFQILFTNANTGAATAALNGLAALAITKNGATALAAGDIPAGSIKILAYDGTRLQIVGNIGGGGSVTSVTGTTNRITSTGGATPVIDIDAAFEALLQKLINTATALTDAASMDLTAIKHTLTTSSATRTFTISYTGDDITLIVTLNTTATVFTFPATSLCVSEGIASGDNTCSISAVSGDKIAIAIKKVGSDYYVVAKNFGQ